MLRFHCPSCQNELFFGSFDCLNCGLVVSYDPHRAAFCAVAPDHTCQNRTQHGLCNWIAEPNQSFCLACAANAIIPDLSITENLEKWRHLEEGKRRLFYSCLRLGLDLSRLSFKFLASTPQQNVTTGYCDGVITLNIGEADPVTREATRQNLNERFRTLVGHFRHEFGHHYWQTRVKNDARVLEEFRALFGDETVDYAASLDRYYSSDTFKGQEYVSVYATSHPWEDWAETFAHYLHLRDVLETAAQFGLSPCSEFAFEEGVQQWTRLSVAFNEINRSMGLPDLYPFTLTDQVVDKLRFIHRLVSSPMQAA